MERIVGALYENGVLTPLQPLDLPDHQRVTRYEILRGLKARDATRQVALFEHQWMKSPG